MDADDAVLVVLMNNARDLKIAREEHWYRIPLKHAPAQFSRAKYLAFYLTSAFRADKWSIRDYAPVLGHELARRRDLFPTDRDHPRADDAYYKIQIGKLIALPRAITSRVGRRVLFIWTTGAKFSSATELNDLFSDDGDALWNALKEQGIRAERQIAVRDGRARYRVDFWIPCARGDIALNLSNTTELPKGKKWRALKLDPREIGLKSKAWTRKIQKMIRELGGEKYSDRKIA
ncbi:MAG: hypothetical protein HY257_11160 [Chloroflexi bacterium]|nr:hypothetical protein [Chloroflexota bacterium]